MEEESNIYIKNYCALLFIFVFLESIWFTLSFRADLYIYIASFVFLIPFCFFIYYMISEGIIWQIISGIIVGFILMAIAAAVPVIGWILLALWFIYNLSMSIKSVKNLALDAFISASMFSLLYFNYKGHIDKSLDTHSSPFIMMSLIYLSISLLICYRSFSRACRPKDILFFSSITILSIPIISLILMSIVSSIRSFFDVNFIKDSIKVPQDVSGYVTSNGTVVSSYTRNVSATITTSTITPGTGALEISATGALGKDRKKNDKK